MGTQMKSGSNLSRNWNGEISRCMSPNMRGEGRGRGKGSSIKPSTYSQEFIKSITKHSLVFQTVYRFKNDLNPSIPNVFNVPPQFCERKSWVRTHLPQLHYWKGSLLTVRYVFSRTTRTRPTPTPTRCVPTSTETAPGTISVSTFVKWFIVD